MKVFECNDFIDFHVVTKPKELMKSHSTLGQRKKMEQEYFEKNGIRKYFSKNI